MSLIRQYLEEKKGDLDTPRLKAKIKPMNGVEDDDKKEDDFANEPEEQDDGTVSRQGGLGTKSVASSDYKIGPSGKKIPARRIVFNKGQDDGRRGIGEEVVEEEMTDTQMKKREEYVKGMKKKYSDFVDKYGADRAKSVMYATATKMAMKEESELEEEAVDEGWEDMLADVKKRAANAPKSTTLTHHDVKKTSTGTVYTKQHDKDGMSKGTGAPETEQKRGRGRPKKDKFAEAVEFLMDLPEDQFDEAVSEGLDAFFESFLEEGKGYAPGWMLKADPKLGKKIDDVKKKHKAIRNAMGKPEAGVSAKKDNK